MHFNNPDNYVDSDWVRLWDCLVTWKDIHIGPDQYNWSRLDALVDQYSDRNILYCIAATPRWLATNPNAPHFAPWLGPGTNSLPYDIDEFNKFVWNLATRYKGKIKAYEIWNEPQLSDFMYPYTLKNRNRLALMTKRAYGTIKNIDPNALVIGASILPRKSSGGMKRAKKYLRALKRKKWPVDRMAVHIYPEIGSGPLRWASYLSDAKVAVKKMGGPTKLWITETNYNLQGQIIDGLQAWSIIKDTYKYAGKHPVFWYSWDMTPVLGGLNLKENSTSHQAIKRYNDV